MENFKKACVEAYENGCPKITDAEFDRTFGDNRVEIGTEDKVKLPFWMGSLDKIRTQRALDNWLGDDKNIVASAKIDGVSGLYHEGEMFTRGNGEYGKNISKVLKYLNLPVVEYTVRGEIVMKKNTFREKYGSFKNARNTVAGLLNRKDEGDELYDITFYAYEIVGKKLKPSEQYFKLREDGFAVPLHLLLSGRQNFDDLYDPFRDLEYETDGVVVTIDLPYTQPTEGNPKFAAALKKDFNEDTRIAYVKRVEWNISKWRMYKPVVVIEPVELKGVKITRTSGFNAKYIFDNKINAGSIIRLKRSGGVIPTILDVLSRSDSPSVPPVETLRWVGVNLMAPENTPEEGVKKLTDTVSYLGIKHLNRATAAKLYEAGFTTLLKVVFAEKKGFLSAGVGEKMAEKITASIHSLFFIDGVDVSKLLTASCCFGSGIGEKIIRLLFDHIPEFMIKKSVSRNEMVAIPGFGRKRVDIIEENYEKALEYLRTFSINGVKILFPRRVAATNDAPDGYSKARYAFTGFRDPELESKLDVFDAVSKKIDYLVVKSVDLKTTKIAKAKKLEIKIITLDELRNALAVESNSRPNGAPEVTNIRKSNLRKKGYKDLEDWLKNPQHVYIGRDMTNYVPGAIGSVWGNPFSTSKMSREECCKKYEEYILTDKKKMKNGKTLRESLGELKGKTLGCWCHPELCHGHVLAKLVGELEVQ